jgi:DNA polymerase III subunit alpha
VGFVHLHCHSQFSLLDGTAKPDDLAERAAELGMTSLALTDSANLYGAVAFHKAAMSHKLHPVLGAELHVQPEGIDHDDGHREESGYQLLALVENEQGYLNLAELITRGIFDGMRYKPRVDLDLLRRHHEGLIFLTGGMKGVIGRAVTDGESGRLTSDMAALTAFLDPEHLFIELSDHGLDGQDAVLEASRMVASELGYQTVVTNAVHYLAQADAPIHEVLNAIATGASLADPTRIRCNTDQAWLKSEAEMRELFPDDGEAIERTVAIAQRCQFAFDYSTYHFPATTPPDTLEDGTQPDTDANWAYFYRAFPPPQDYGLPTPEEAIPTRPEGAGNLEGYFIWYASEGLKLRLQFIDAKLHAEYHDRLEREVGIVNSMGFPAYLLIVAEFINWSKDNEIPVGPGRGSAAGSLAAYAMRITDIDPIRYGLLFERFLNPERVSMPDIDVDFCQDRREEAIEHVREKYGSELVSQIITYGTLKAKAAIRDVARVLDLSFTEADRIAKLVPEKLGTTLDDALQQEPRLRALADGDPRVRRVLAIARAIEGCLRQTGVHAAGVVIADKPLISYAPLYRDDPEGGPVVQYDMKSAEKIGLIKFDFLGLKTLDQIRNALQLIAENYGETIDMSQIDEDDRPTYELLQAGDALGIFQLESSGMRDLLTRLKPSSMDDMVALVALYRPGPLQSGMTDDFVDRKHGRRDVTYALPQLEPLLSSTYGTIIYQEQVMQIAQVMAGYSLGEADILRRAMGKKDLGEMDRQRNRFVTGSESNGIATQIAENIFDLMAKFAAYGFNKSHSAAYGYISYQTAWLKAHYRPEYMAALMTIESANTDKLLAYIVDCRRAGIVVEPVCLNASESHFSVPPPSKRPVDEDGNRLELVRFGMCAIKNVGDAAVEAVLEARKAAGGAFESAFAFFEHVDLKRVNRRVIENLVKAGAFDFSGLPRSALLKGLESAISLGGRRQADKAAGQRSIFALMAPAARPPPFKFPDTRAWPLSKSLAAEKEVLGLYLSGHPMTAHASDVERLATARLAGLMEVRGDDEVRVLGLVAEMRIIRTRRGDRMAFVRIEDQDTSVECIFFSDSLTRSRGALEAGEPVLVSGRLESGGDELKIRANTAERLTEARSRTTREVRLEVSATDLDQGRLEALRAVLEGQRGSTPARLLVDFENLRASFDLPKYPVEPSTELEDQVHTLFGRYDVVRLS